LYLQFFKSSILFLYSCISGISQKTLSPFNSSSQCHSTNRFNNIIHIVNAEAVSSIASRFASISIYSHQLLARHTNLSLLRSLPAFLIFLCQSFDGI
jgi:hypothetical protein